MDLATLDDPEAVSHADPGGMLQLVGGLGKQLRHGFDLGREASVPWGHRPRAVLACGMGGSGIAGDVVRSLLIDRVDVPIAVSKGYRLPAFCGPDTAVFAISYSGGTEETLSVYGEATARGCPVVAIGCGGELLARAEADGASRVRLPSDVPMPRAALGYLAGALLGWLGAAGSVDLDVELAEAVTEIARCGARWGPSVPGDRNEAKILAAWLRTRIPVVWGSEGIADSAALRWKTQINENAKGPAFWGVLPEVDHNEVEGWATRTGDPFGLVVLRHPGEHRRTELRVRASFDAFRSAGLEAREAVVEGEGPASSLFSLIMLGDFVSAYLALLRGVDPTPVPVLSALKERLRS
jgi:glucose/mannose-6-phosphate isomerase